MAEVNISLGIDKPYVQIGACFIGGWVMGSLFNIGFISFGLYGVGWLLLLGYSYKYLSDKYKKYKGRWSK